MSKRVPKLTIGMPVKNGGDSVADAIRSLLAQDFEDFELLISDNASTDATSELCQAFLATDQRVSYRRLTEDVGALRNFERLLLQGRGEFFMWAAHDDRWAPSFVSRCIESLESLPHAISAITDIRVINAGGFPSVHPFSADITSSDRRRRFRWILRGGGWGAIYGVHRRQVLSQTRTLSLLRNVPAPGLSPDYLVLELSLLGPFVRISEPLLQCRGPRPEPPEHLAARLDPHRHFRADETMFGWLVRDLWAMGRRYKLSSRACIALQADFLWCASSSGTLHDVLLGWNTNALRAAVENRRRARLAALVLQRLLLDPPLIRLKSWIDLILPPALEQPAAAESDVIRTLPPITGERFRVDFTQSGNGAFFLGFGWGEVESWGTWTIAPRADIRMRTQGRPDCPVEIDITGQMFVGGGMPNPRASVRLNRGPVVPFAASSDQPNVAIHFVTMPADFARDREIVLEFEIDRPVSPAEQGIGPDTRKLGFGLKAIEIATRTTDGR